MLVQRRLARSGSTLGHTAGVSLWVWFRPRNRVPHEPIAPLNTRAGLVGIDIGQQHDEGRFHVPAGGIRRGAVGFVMRVGGNHHDAERTLDELPVRQFEVHHHVLVNLPEADHRRRRDHVEDRLGVGVDLHRVRIALLGD